MTRENSGSSWQDEETGNVEVDQYGARSILIMQDTINISGSWGKLIADASTGEVLCYDPQGQFERGGNPLGEYADILAVDVAEWREEYPGEEPTHLDILDIGFWTDTGTYIGAENDHRSEAAWDAAQARMFPAKRAFLRDGAG